MESQMNVNFEWLIVSDIEPTSLRWFADEISMRFYFLLFNSFIFQSAVNVICGTAKYYFCFSSAWVTA